tara:strand:+ start:3335 stop:3568 length:234 start_codon:yes stop_codon:yes gene_type:complete
MERFMIKGILCKAFGEWKLSNGYTYKWIENNTDLNETQVMRILKKDGVGVSVEAIEKVLIDSGCSLDLKVNLKNSQG